MPRDRLTEHFARDEFVCRHGLIGDEAAAREVCENLEALREYLGGRPIEIVSGYRCLACNQAARGVKHSQHLLSRAADIRIDGLSVRDIAQAIEELIAMGKMRQGGIGRYYRARGNRPAGFVHYDIRGTWARWDNLLDGERG